MFKCDQCDKQYTRKTNLNNHKRSFHEGIKFACDQCNKTFSLKAYLKIHIKKAHINPVFNEPTPAILGNPPHEVLENVEDNMQKCIEENISAITQYKSKRVKSFIVNFNLLKKPLEKQILMKVLRYHKFSFKINASPGFILEQKLTKTLKYFHASSGRKDTILPYPVTITSRSEFEDFVDLILKLDITDLLKNKTPSSQWKVKVLTNLSFYTYILSGHALRAT